MREPNINLQLVIFSILGVGLFIVSLAGVGANLQSDVGKLATGSVAGVTQLLRSVDSYTSLFTSLQEVRDENFRYRNRVAELEAQLNKQQELIEENKWLKSQLLLELSRPQQSGLARVLKYEYSPSIGYVYATASTDVRVGDLATVYDYIVGEVVEVSFDIARIRLLAANDSSLLVKVGEQSVVGKLVGRGGLGLQIEELQANSQVGLGDEIRLLNPVGPYATNYELGRVSGIEGTPADPLWSLSVDLPVDLFKLEHLIIIPNHE